MTWGTPVTRNGSDPGGKPVTVFLCGDVMLGRGVDQALAYPSDPRLVEPAVRDARHYLALAEAVSGPVPRPVGPAWLWGDALDVLESLRPDARVMNLETSICTGGDFAPGKVVHYRMNPRNIAALTVARPDVCVLANNHVMDFGVPGLEETLDSLAAARLRACGAGRSHHEAWRPVVVGTEHGRVVVISVGTESSGIPRDWAAGANRPGIALADVSRAGAATVADQIRAVKEPGHVVVVSIHWGSNWGYDVPRSHVAFAHRLVDAGADVVHGHSSHHPRPIELYRGKLILYGCGDFIDDYEGIGGFEEYRDELRLMYVATLDPDSGRLAGLRMVPMRARRLRLERASHADASWLADRLDSVSAGFGVKVRLDADGVLTLPLLDHRRQS